MPVRTRLSLAVALLVTLLLALTAVAVGCLWSLHLAGAAVIAGLAGLGAVAAVRFADGVARELADESEGLVIEPPPEPMPAPIAARELPAQAAMRAAAIAHLPPEYVAAVMKGAQARHAAFRAQAGQKPGAVVH